MQLILDRLTKQYGSKIALDRIDATFEPGIYGLLGANGAGQNNHDEVDLRYIEANFGGSNL